MQATIRIQMDNAAFNDHNGEELARILRDLADWAENYNHGEDDCSRGLSDYNGNRVGRLSFAP